MYAPIEFFGRGFFMEVKGDQQMGSPSQNTSFGWLQSVSPDL